MKEFREHPTAREVALLETSSIRQKALNIAAELGYTTDQFAASDHWIRGFQRRQAFLSRVASRQDSEATLTSLVMSPDSEEAASISRAVSPDIQSSNFRSHEELITLPHLSEVVAEAIQYAISDHGVPPQRGK
jgi:hypothetical protein